MNVLNLSAFADFFCGETTIDLKQAIHDKKIIIFNLSKGKIGKIASEHIGKMLIAIIQNLIFQRAHEKEEDRIPINIYVDEFQDFINESIEEIFVQGRKYKVSLTVACQVVGQKMTQDMTKTVLSNTNVKFIGRNGYQSLSIMSKEAFTEIEELKDLPTGNFFTTIDKRNGFILKIGTDYLKNKTCISDTEREKVLAHQIKKYYKPRPLFGQGSSFKEISWGVEPPRKMNLDKFKKDSFTPKY